MLRVVTQDRERAGPGSVEGVVNMTKASGTAGVGCSGMRCANPSHHTFPSECEGLQADPGSGSTRLAQGSGTCIPHLLQGLCQPISGVRLQMDLQCPG